MLPSKNRCIMVDIPAKDKSAKNHHVCLTLTKLVLTVRTLLLFF